MTETIYAYIARDRSDNTCFALAIDYPGLAETNAAHVAGWIRAGAIVERVPIEQAKAALWQGRQLLNWRFGVIVKAAEFKARGNTFSNEALAAHLIDVEKRIDLVQIRLH